MSAGPPLPLPERRKGDRRREPREPLHSTWTNPPASRLDEAEFIDGDSSGDSRFIAREARRLVSTHMAALPRILRTYVAARAALGVALVLAPWVASLTVGRAPLPLMLVCLTYAAQAVSLWLLHGSDEADGSLPDRLATRQWVWTIGVDLLSFSLLRLLDAPGQLNYSALLVLPALMSGVLTRRRVALATVAGITLLLLLSVWPLAHQGGDWLVLMSQAGLTGAGLFLVTLVASELSQRLAREESSARKSLALARQQTRLNRLVIEEMTDGVIVADRDGRLRAVNPAARQLLGLTLPHAALPHPMADEPGLAELLDALQAAYELGNWPADAQEVSVLGPDGDSRRLQVRARFTRRGDVGLVEAEPEDICVIFLEDLQTVLARARQDKLAAMGRVSAGIAHEIRNPLAAIAQANDLLREDHLSPTHQRLADIVAANVERLKRIVDDVLAVTPGSSGAASVIDVHAEARQIVEEWLRDTPNDVRAAPRLICTWPAHPLLVRFDVEHLRRVLVNLLDNAMRHASPADGAVKLSLSAGPPQDEVRLAVASDGKPIGPDVERYLFEPFFSTRSRGSGLGLYICRELCERHAASIEFNLASPQARHRNVFSVAMRSARDGLHPSAQAPSP